MIRSLEDYAIFSLIGLHSAFWMFRPEFKKFMEEPSFLQDVAHVGDAFNIATSVFTILAFIWLKKTLSHEIKVNNQNEEHRRNERVESNFYQLTGNLRQIIDSWTLEVTENETTRNFKGRNCFNGFTRRLRGTSTVDVEAMTQITREAYVEYFATLCFNDTCRYERYLIPYKRLLFHIVNSIHESDIADKQKETFINIFESEFIDAEVKILAVMGLQDDDLKQLIERYGLLEYLPQAVNMLEFYRLSYDDVVFDRAVIGRFYHENAFIDPSMRGLDASQRPLIRR